MKGDDNANRRRTFADDQRRGIRDIGVSSVRVQRDSSLDLLMTQAREHPRYIRLERKVIREKSRRVNPYRPLILIGNDKERVLSTEMHEF